MKEPVISGRWIVYELNIDNLNENLIGLKLCYIFANIPYLIIDKMEIEESGDIGDFNDTYFLKTIDNLETFIDKFRDKRLYECYIKGNLNNTDVAFNVQFFYNEVTIAHDKNSIFDINPILNYVETNLKELEHIK